MEKQEVTYVHARYTGVTLDLEGAPAHAQNGVSRYRGALYIVLSAFGGRKLPFFGSYDCARSFL